MLAIGRQVQRRPYVQEAVAPYVRPRTPETRSLSSDEAREALERDWLHQADRKPTPERIRQEITWARELAERAFAPSTPPVPCPPRRRAPAPRTSRRSWLSSPPWSSAPRRLPAPIAAFISRSARSSAASCSATRCWTSTRCCSWTCRSRRAPSGRTRPGIGSATWRCRARGCWCWKASRPTASCANSCPRRPCTARSGGPTSPSTAAGSSSASSRTTRNRFTSTRSTSTAPACGSSPTARSTTWIPIYLPDEQHIVFSHHARPHLRALHAAHQRLRAGPLRPRRRQHLFHLRQQRAGLPALRHERRPHRLHALGIHRQTALARRRSSGPSIPTARRCSMLWGNQSVWPDLLKDARAIPGSRRVMFTGSAHHDWFAGSVGIIDPDAGLNFPHGLTKVTADVPWPECGNGPVDPDRIAPLPSQRRVHGLLLALPAQRTGFPRLGQSRRQVRALPDGRGRQPRADLRRRPQHLPRAAPQAAPQTAGDAGRGRLARGRQNAPRPRTASSSAPTSIRARPLDLRGKAKFLRVLSIDPKTYTYWHQRPYISTGPVVSGVQSEGVKRVLGTVPDRSGRLGGLPGARRHLAALPVARRRAARPADHAQLRQRDAGRIPRLPRLPRTPQHAPRHRRDAPWLSPGRRSKITPPPWTDVTVSYPRYVRPVLDQYCSKCHTGEGEGRKKLDLTARPGSWTSTRPIGCSPATPPGGQPYQMPAKPPARLGHCGYADGRGLRHHRSRGLRHAASR